MPRAGFEPAWDCSQGILSPLCLPIPPPGLQRETCLSATTYASLSHLVSILIEMRRCSADCQPSGLSLAVTP